MTFRLRSLIAAVLITAVLSALAGYAWNRSVPAPSMSATGASMPASPKVLYWYDPMQPTQHFDKPGKSPFMEMQLVPKYVENDTEQGAGVRIDPRLEQNLGIRTANVERSEVSMSFDVPGTVLVDERLSTTLQARTAGFVSRTYARAPGDLVAPDAPIVDVLVPDWAAAQTEYLSLLGSGEASLVALARQRLVLLGMPDALIAQLSATRQVHPEVTVRSPTSGVIDTLDVRAGMTISMGATLARIQGLDPIWIEAAVPEAQGALTAPGRSAIIRCTAYPGESFRGRIVAVLPQTNADSHTVRVRIELPNPTARLKPGMFAEVRLGASQPHSALLVPTEAVIHTGTRDLVILEAAAGRFEPVQVRAGPEYDARTSILAGLEEGQKVVVSGQFLIDSEASLRGIAARMIPPGTRP